jgi:hypothetical protein
MHDETYRMLGREHTADLEREAAKRRVASKIREERRARAAVASSHGRPKSRPSLAFWARLLRPI